MDILLGVLLGLIIGGGGAWITASSRAKSSLERIIRDLEGKAKGAEASRDAVQRQATTFQKEIDTLKSQQEKFQDERIQLSGEIKTLEARRGSLQENVDEYLKQISNLRENNEHFRSTNVDRESQISIAKERLSATQKKFEDSQTDLSKLRNELQKIKSENANLQIEISVADNKKDNLQENINSLSHQFEALKCEKNEELESLGKQHQQVINGLKEQMADTFKVLAADALKQGSQAFRFQADEDLTRRQKSIEGIVKPVEENMIKLEKEIRELEKERTGSYRELKSQVDSLIQLEKDLRQETGNLVKALRQPTGRGQWGEVILEKVLEMSGMVENVHYLKQISASSDNGVIRPDIIVTLPSSRNLVIDAKAVMSAYLTTILDSENDSEREKGYREHAAQLRSRINDLSKKEYSDQFQPSPEFVILFLPAESLLSYALQFDKQLLEYAATKNIILATPTILIALLRTVYYGWKQDEIAKSAKEIGQIGNELYDRLSKMIEHFNNVGKSIKKSGEFFDKTAGSFNSMLRPSINRLRVKAGKEQNEIGEIDSLDIMPKNFYELSQD